MKIVIDVSENIFTRLFDNGIEPSFEDREAIYTAIRGGVPLPKGHGRLIDENEIKQMIEEAKVRNENSKTFAENIIKFTPTVIEGET